MSTTLSSNRKDSIIVSMEMLSKSATDFNSKSNDVFNHELKTTTTLDSNSDSISPSLRIPTLDQKIPNTAVRFNGPTSEKNLRRKICSAMLTSKLLHVADRESPSSPNAIVEDYDSCCSDSKDNNNNTSKESLSSMEMKKSHGNSADVFDPKSRQCYSFESKNGSGSCEVTPLITTPPLTLSAYRRPEVTVRITDCDPSKSLSQKYRLYHNKVLGYGASSTARLATRRSDGQRVAVKCIPKHVVLRELRRLEEVALLRRLNHPNVVALHDVYEHENEIQMVMECCEGGELYDAIQNSRTRNFLESYGEHIVAHIVKQLLSALEYIHSRGLVHRDVKPENILLESKEIASNMKVKLSDFGLARILHQAETSPTSPKPNHKRKLSEDCSFSPRKTPSYKSPISLPAVHIATSGTGAISNPLVTKVSRSRAYSRCGSDFYSAPEIESGVGYDTSVDIYALGVTTYILVCGRYPPNPHDSTRNASELFTEPQWKLASSQAKDFIRSMLDPEPCSRITAKNALEHNWITNANNINHNIYHGEPTKEHKLNSIAFDLDLFCNTTAFVDTDDVGSDDEADDTTSLPQRQFCVV